MQIDTYEKDGEKRTAAKVVIGEITFCGSGQAQESVSIESNQFTPMPGEDVDLPF